MKKDFTVPRIEIIKFFSDIVTASSGVHPITQTHEYETAFQHLQNEIGEQSGTVSNIMAFDF